MYFFIKLASLKASRQAFYSIRKTLKKSSYDYIIRGTSILCSRAQMLVTHATMEDNILTSA